MAFVGIDIDFAQIKGFAAAMKEAPAKLVRHTALAFRRMGASDIEKFRAEQLQGGSGLRVRSKGLAKSFKYRTGSEPKDISQLKLEEYTGWRAARIFETGGTVGPRKRRALTVITDAGRRGSGKRRYGVKAMKAAIDSGELKVIRTRGGNALIVRNVDKLTKTGKARKNNRSEIIAVIVRSVKQRKRLDFFGNFNRNAAVHEVELAKAAQDTIDEVAASKGAK